VKVDFTGLHFSRLIQIEVGLLPDVNLYAMEGVVNLTIYAVINFCQ